MPAVVGNPAACARMESHLDEAGVLPLRLTCVLNGIASFMLSASLKKALSFRAVELGLRMAQVVPGVV